MPPTINNNLQRKVQFDLLPSEKRDIDTVLTFFDQSNWNIGELRCHLTHKGMIELTVQEALMLAGLIQPWLPGISNNIFTHPDMFPLVAEDAHVLRTDTPPTPPTADCDPA